MKGFVTFLWFVFALMRQLPRVKLSRAWVGGVCLVLSPQLTAMLGSLIVICLSYVKGCLDGGDQESRLKTMMGRGIGWRVGVNL